MSKRPAPLCASILKKTLVASLVVSVAGLASVGYADEGTGPNKESISTPPPSFTPDAALSQFADNLTYNEMIEKTLFLGEPELKRSIVEILKQNKPGAAYILGPKGAGKTSFVQSLAGELPNRQIWSLKVNDLEAGTHYRGALEDRLKAFFEAFKKDKSLILYIDEFHSIMSIKGVADTLKPLMSSKQITVLASTTEDEYEKFVAQADGAFADRAPVFRMEEHKFQKVLDIIRMKAVKIASDYKVHIGDDALVRATKLAFRFYEGSPSRVVERIVERAANRKATNRDQDVMHFNALKFNDEIQTLRGNVVRWTAEYDRKQGIFDTSALEIQIEEANDQIKNLEEKRAEVEAMRQMENLNEQFASAARLVRDVEKAAMKDPSTANVELLMEKREILGKIQQQREKLGNGGPLREDPFELTAKEVGHFVAKEVGISDQATNESDLEKLIRLRDGLKKKIFGQDAAIDALVDAIGIRLASMEPVDKPIVIMAVGPPGTGKSTFEEALGELWFGDKSRVVGIEMNNVGTGGSWDLWGPSKGYVGSEEGSRFEPVRRRPFSLVSLREFEKAPGRIYDGMLQALGKGEQADSRGRIINFRNAIIMMDGNLAERWGEVRDHGYPAAELENEFKLPKGTLEGKTLDQMDQIMIDVELTRHGFSGAFKDRAPLRFFFKRPTPENAKMIIRSKLKAMVERVKSEKRVQLDFGDLDAAIEAGVSHNVGDTIIENYYHLNGTGRYYGDDLRETLISSGLKNILLQDLPPNTVVKVEFKPTETAIEGGPAGDIEYKVILNTREGKGSAAKLIPVKDELQPEVRKGAALFKQVAEKPSLTLGRTTGAAGHAAEDTSEGKTKEGETDVVVQPRPIRIHDVKRAASGIRGR